MTGVQTCALPIWSNLTLTIDAGKVTWLKEAEALVQQGHVTGASHRNWASYSSGIELPAGMPDWRRHLLTDPQTSGGLLIACEAGKAEAIAASIRQAGYPSAAVIGRAQAGKPVVRIEG